MKKLIVTCTFLCLASSNFAAETAKEIIAATWARVDLQLAFNHQFAANQPRLSSNNQSEIGTRSVAKAVLFSAAIPGAGQIYNGSILKSILFLALEAGALTGHFINQNRGNELEDEFEDFADLYWSEQEYWESLAQESGLNVNDLDALREYERQNFSHFLPQQKNQQYYENIGKYDQFNAGWDDSENIRARDSVHREQYTLMRKDANDHFKRATNFAAAALFNHVLSALEAGWSAKRHNKQIMKASLEMQGRLYGTEVVPTLVLGMTW